MELWIRSQDKRTLVKCESVETINNFIKVNGHYDVGYFDITKDGKKRALEVLDEIQSRLMPYSEIIQDTEGITISYKNISAIIYEIPKE